MSTLKFSMLLQAIDRVSAPGRRIQSAMQRISRGARDMVRDIGRADQGAAPLGRLEAASRRLAGAFAAAGRAARHWAGRAGLASWGDAAELAGFGVGRLARKMAGLAATTAKWAVGATAAAGGLALFDLFGTASKFEQYQIQLETTLGTADKAKAAMAWVQRFAQKTPYELDQVMEAFVALQSYGIEPMNGTLEALGDAASGMNKQIGDAVEALADGMNGQMERLLEFGIRGSSAGQKVSFTYTKAGKEITVQARKGADAMKALVKIMNDRFGGLMQKQSLTFGGMISNLTDAWNGFLLRIARAGIFDKVKAKLEELLAWIGKLADNGTLDKWAKRISDTLGVALDKAVQFVRSIDWAGAARQLQAIATAATILADAIITIAKYGKALSWLSAIAQNGVPLATKLYTEFGGPLGRALNAPAAPPRRQPVPLPPAPAPRQNNTYRPGAGPLKVGGAVKVEVVPPPGWSVRPRSTTSSNADVPLLLQYGRTMGGAG